jgi:hypothetical protein
LPKFWSVFVGARKIRPNARSFSRADDLLLQQVTTRHFPRGYTILNAAGGWFDAAANRFVREESRQVLITCSSARAVRQWAQELGTALHQKELLIVQLGRAEPLKIKRPR